MGECVGEAGRKDTEYISRNAQQFWKREKEGGVSHLLAAPTAPKMVIFNRRKAEDCTGIGRGCKSGGLPQSPPISAS